MRKIIFIIVTILVIVVTYAYILTRPHPDKIYYSYDDIEGTTVEGNEVLLYREFAENFGHVRHRVQVFLIEDDISEEEINQQLEENPDLSKSQIILNHYETINKGFITKHDLGKYNPTSKFTASGFLIPFYRGSYSEILYLMLELSKDKDVMKIIFIEHLN